VGSTVVRWALLCAAAEAAGMTASAVAGRGAADLDPAGGLALIVAGGLVEGVALGTAQTVAFGDLLPRRSRRRYAAVTVLVAGLGWAAASAPSALADDGSAGESPPLVLVLAGAAALGAVMGGVLGWAQSLTMRGQVARPRRWVLANVVAWPPAMAVIFAGATSAPASWSLPQVALLGTATGAGAGLLLGGVLGCFVPGLEEPRRVA
jgi:hypothetical protein